MHTPGGSMYPAVTKKMLDLERIYEFRKSSEIPYATARAQNFQISLV